MGQLGGAVSSDTLLAAMKGEPQAVGALAEAYWPIAYRLAVAVLGRRGPDAEDAAQDATLALARGVVHLSEPSKAGAWSAVIAIRSAQRIKRRKKDVVHIDELRLATTNACQEDMLDMERALRMLPTELRVPLVLYVVFGYTSGEVGAILGVPDGTVRYRISRARERLRIALNRSTGLMLLEGRENDAVVR